MPLKGGSQPFCKSQKSTSKYQKWLKQKSCA
jgi:hypothetical protein